MVDPWSGRDSVRRLSLADESVISIRAERKSGPSSSDSSKNSIHEQDNREAADPINQMSFAAQDVPPDKMHYFSDTNADEHSCKHQSPKSHQRDPDATPSRNPVDRRRVCSYYLRGCCAFGNGCRFWHPENPEQATFGKEENNNSKTQQTFKGRFVDWPLNQPPLVVPEAPAPPVTPKLEDKGDIFMGPGPLILVDEGGDWSPTAEVEFGFDANQQGIPSPPNQGFHHEPGGDQHQEEHQQQLEADDWWTSQTPSPVNEQEPEADVKQDITHLQPEEEEPEHELLREHSTTPMPPMPIMSMSTPTETSPSKSCESMRMSTTEASQQPKSLESVPAASALAYEELVDSLKLQLEKAEEERDRLKMENEEHQRNDGDGEMTTEEMRELYKLREDYARLQAHAIELMERIEISDKVRF